MLNPSSSVGILGVIVMRSSLSRHRCLVIVVGSSLSIHRCRATVDLGSVRNEAAVFEY